MFARQIILAIVIGVICYDGVCLSQIVGGWSQGGSIESMTEMVKLARHQLKLRTKLPIDAIEVVRLETQVVAGLNMRLTFLVDDKTKCVLTAFKPLPYTNEPTEVTSFKCKHASPTHDSSENDD